MDSKPSKSTVVSSHDMADEAQKIVDILHKAGYDVSPVHAMGLLWAAVCGLAQCGVGKARLRQIFESTIRVAPANMFPADDPFERLKDGGIVRKRPGETDAEAQARAERSAEETLAEEQAESETLGFLS